jgi:hypothetical protein
VEIQPLWPVLDYPPNDIRQLDSVGLAKNDHGDAISQKTQENEIDDPNRLPGQLSEKSHPSKSQ